MKYKYSQEKKVFVWLLQISKFIFFIMKRSTIDRNDSQPFFRVVYVVKELDVTFGQVNYQGRALYVFKTPKKKIKILIFHILFYAL